MSVSKSYVNDPANVEAVLIAYKADDKPTVKDLAQRLETTAHNVQHIVRAHLSPEEFQAEKALRYSRSKTGTKNPMRGKSGSLHHNFVGEIEDGHGYLMRKVSGRYEQSHRIVMAELLGFDPPVLPRTVDVHHIDGNKRNNDPDNLAVVTNVGHRTLHRTTGWSRSPLWDQWVSGTSRSKETIPTQPTDS